MRAERRVKDAGWKGPEMEVAEGGTDGEEVLSVGDGG